MHESDTVAIAERELQGYVGKEIITWYPDQTEDSIDQCSCFSAEEAGEHLLLRVYDPVAKWTIRPKIVTSLHLDAEPDLVGANKVGN